MTRGRAARGLGARARRGAKEGGKPLIIAGKGRDPPAGTPGPPGRRAARPSAGRGRPAPPAPRRTGPQAAARRRAVAAVERAHRLARRRRGRRVGAVEPAREEGLDLVALRAAVLRVGVPEERDRRPLRAHERVLAAHDRRVAAPQQAVEVGLRHEGNRRERERLAHERRADRGQRARPVQASIAAGGGRLRHERDRRRGGGGPGVEERDERRLRIGEEEHDARAGRGVDAERAQGRRPLRRVGAEAVALVAAAPVRAAARRSPA